MSNETPGWASWHVQEERLNIALVEFTVENGNDSVGYLADVRDVVNFFKDSVIYNIFPTRGIFSMHYFKNFEKIYMLFYSSETIRTLG